MSLIRQGRQMILIFTTHIKDTMNEAVSILLPPTERVAQINVSRQGGTRYV